MKQNGVNSFANLRDEELMLQLQSGRENAFDIIVNRYQTRLYNFLIRYTKNHEDTEDLIQETFLRVYRSRNSYEPIARFSTWLFTIAGNLMRTQHKKNSRMPVWSLDDDEQDANYTIQLPSDISTPEQVTHSEMTLALIHKAFSGMPQEYSELLNLREMRELSYEEIAEAVNLPMGTVKSRINRGRIKLQEAFKHMKDDALIYAA
jgi:RNA polymerase sigma factor (sigma-70 family)